MKIGAMVENLNTGERGRVKSVDELVAVVDYGEKVGDRLEVVGDLGVLAHVNRDLGDEQG